VASENVHLEILRGGAPVPDGEEGEVVVTVLTNRAMPLIRYNLGDWARRIPGRCGCGRWLPRIELTNTKVVDLVRTSRGGAASGQFFDYILIELIDRGNRGIRQFLVIQKELDTFLVQVVPGPDLKPDCLALFERRMREQLGDQIEVRFELVKEIPREPAGKIRCFRSELSPQSAQAETRS
jgi:phenylacetate-CoA ligase